MTPLRQHMIDTMLLHGFAQRTQDSYLSAVEDLVRFTRVSPDKLPLQRIEDWLLYLAKERKLSSSSRHLYFNGIRFLFIRVLKRTDFADYGFTLPKKQQRIPELLNPHEVGALVVSPTHARHRMMLKLCYGCGLRLSELVRVTVADIDGQQSVLRVTQGKGHTDRLIPIGSTLLRHLRGYWLKHRPTDYLFAGQQPGKPIGVTTPQKVYTQAKADAGVRKMGGIHSLRHAYATHSLGLGVPIHQLQQQMGHRHLQSTLRYTHWLPETGDGGKSVDLLAELTLPEHV